METNASTYPLSASRQGQPVRITDVNAASAAERLQRFGVWKGDRLDIDRCTRHGVLVKQPNGKQMLLPQHLARSVMVCPCGDTDC